MWQLTCDVAGTRQQNKVERGGVGQAVDNLPLQNMHALQSHMTFEVFVDTD